MSYSNGVITAPVSIDDVKSALGESSNDVATLCTSPNINMWSRKKPVKLAKIFPDINSDWYKGESVKDDYVNGIECYGVKKNYIDITGITITQNAFVRRHLTYTTPSFVYVPPTGGENAPYRLGDFIGYNGNTAKYDKLGSNPYGANNLNIVTSGGISFGYQLTYSYAGTGDFIGLGELFGCDKGGELYAGVLAEAASNAMFSPEGQSKTKRADPLAIVYRGTKIDGTVNSVTGLDYSAVVSTPNYSMSSKDPSETENYFSNNEYIKVTAGIIKTGTNNKTLFFPLESLWIAPNGFIDTTDYAYISSASIIISLTKDASDGTYWAFVESSTDLNIRIIAPNEGNSLLSFDVLPGFSAMESTMSVQKSFSGIPIVAGSKARTTTINANGISGWSPSNPNRALAMQFKYTGTGSSVKISFSFAIAKKGGINNYSKSVSISLPSAGNTTKSSKLTLV